MSSKNLPLVILVVVAVVLGSGLFILSGEDSSRPLSAINPADKTPEIPKGNGWGDGERGQPTDLAEPETYANRDDNETTVAWPLEVRLELLEGRADPQLDGVPRKSTGANARIAGLVRGLDEQGIAATIAFVAGPNIGRVLHADKTGAFGTNDLFPGLALVKIESSGHVSKREISLRQGREAQLNVSYHRTTDVTGEVIDRDGKPLEGAFVEMDGQRAQTDFEGVFRFSRMTPGKLYVQVDKPGYASHRENLPVAGRQVIERGTLKFTLAKGAKLRVNVAERVGSRGDALLFFMPSLSVGRDRRFPWHEHNPTRVIPGGSVLLEDLPAERVNLWLFHTGAQAKPAAVAVRLRPGTETSKTLHLVPATQVKGTVKRDGQPVRGARVTSEAPDRVSTTTSVFGGGPGFFDTALLPPYPVALEEVFTDDEGKFSLTAWDSVGTAHYVSAFSQDGKYSDCEVLPLGEHEIALDLEPIDLGDSQVIVALPDRFQGLPVKVWVNSAPMEPFVLPHDRDLSIEDLNEGSWMLSARWHGNQIVKDSIFELTDEYRISLHLPEEAILGQTDDELKRAGKR